MAKEKVNKNLDPSTEEKIKNAARAVFHRKGFAATRTREIAEEAGLNLALLNYYFRSKEKLFHIIMIETVQNFFQTMKSVFIDNETTLEEKIVLIADKYIDLVLEEPEIPMFILSELRNDSEDFFKNIPLTEILKQSSFLQQFEQDVQEGKIAKMNPFHYVLNLMGLIVFPFIAHPMLKKIGNLTDEAFVQMVLERKKLIPIWMKTIMSP